MVLVVVVALAVAGWLLVGDEVLELVRGDGKPTAVECSGVNERGQGEGCEPAGDDPADRYGDPTDVPAPATGPGPRPRRR